MWKQSTRNPEGACRDDLGACRCSLHAEWGHEEHMSTGVSCRFEQLALNNLELKTEGGVLSSCKNPSD